MPLHPTPDTVFVLTPRCFSVAAPVASRSDLLSRPTLRVKVTPALLIPAQWAPVKGRRPRNYEDDFEVTVPVGGKVKVDIKVEEAGRDAIKQKHTWDINEESSASYRMIQPDEEFCTRDARELMWKLLNNNKQMLGIDQVRHQDHSDHCEEPIEAGSLIVSPTSGNPTYSPSSNHLIPTGAPVAYLSNVAVMMWWSVPRRGGAKRTRKAQDLEEMDELVVCGDYDDALIDDGEDVMLDEDDDLLYDDDDLLLDNQPTSQRSIASLEPGGATLKEDRSEPCGRGSLLHQQGSEAEVRCRSLLSLKSPFFRQGSTVSEITGSVEDESPGATSIRNEESDDVPRWIRTQVITALQRLIKLHLIKRFPLIFDGGLLSYLSSLQVRPALSQTMANMLALSRRHNTPLNTTALAKLGSIIADMEKVIVNRVERLQALTKRKRLVRPVSDDKRRSKRRKISQEEDTGGVEEYLGNLRCEIREATGKSKRPQEAQISLVVSDAIARIGRAHWDGKRAGSGKLAIGRVQLEVSERGGGEGGFLKAEADTQLSLRERDTTERLGANDDACSLLDDDEEDDLIDDDSPSSPQREEVRTPDSRSDIGGVAYDEDDMLLEDEEIVSMPDTGIARCSPIVLAKLVHAKPLRVDHDHLCLSDAEPEGHRRATPNFIALAQKRPKSASLAACTIYQPATTVVDDSDARSESILDDDDVFNLEYSFNTDAGDDILCLDDQFGSPETGTLSEETVSERSHSQVSARSASQTPGDLRSCCQGRQPSLGIIGHRRSTPGRGRLALSPAA